MTCIVAYFDEDNNKGWIGSDSAAVYPTSMKICQTESKIIKINKNYSMGFCGDFPIQKLIYKIQKEKIEFPSHLKTTRDAEQILETIIDAAEEFSTFTQNVRQPIEAEDNNTTHIFPSYPLNFILVSKYGVWSVEDGVQVIKIQNNYYSIGSGSEEALGALFIMKYNGVSNGEVACQLALMASKEHNGSVIEPFHIEEIK